MKDCIYSITGLLLDHHGKGSPPGLSKIGYRLSARLIANIATLSYLKHS